MSDWLNDAIQIGIGKGMTKGFVSELGLWEARKRLPIVDKILCASDGFVSETHEELGTCEALVEMKLAYTTGMWWWKKYHIKGNKLTSEQKYYLKSLSYIVD